MRKMTSSDLFGYPSYFRLNCGVVCPDYRGLIPGGGGTFPPCHRAQIDCEAKTASCASDTGVPSDL